MPHVKDFIICAHPPEIKTVDKSHIETLIKKKLVVKNSDGSFSIVNQDYRASL